MIIAIQEEMDDEGISFQLEGPPFFFVKEVVVWDGLPGLVEDGTIRNKRRKNERRKKKEKINDF